MFSKLTEIQRRDNAARGFREWLKNSLKEAKKAQYMKKQIKKFENKEKPKDREAKWKVQNSIWFKEWKLKKIREERHEKRRRKNKERMEREQLMMLKHQRKLINKAGDVMLAYSLNKSIKDIENIRRRPKSARIGFRS